MLKFNIRKKYVSRSRTVSVHCEGEVEPGKSIGIYGKSGIGKSSVLRMIAGLDLPDQGSVVFDNKTWFNSNTNLRPSQRRIGFVFQDYQLFDNMSIQANLEYVSQNSISKQILEFIKNSELNELISNYPTQLSGGERQRFSLLRALCQEPDLLILDEPFSALDDESTESMIGIVKAVQKKQNFSIIAVSHRKETLSKLTDSIINMNNHKN